MSTFDNLRSKFEKLGVTGGSRGVDNNKQKPPPVPPSNTKPPQYNNQGYPVSQGYPPNQGYPPSQGHPQPVYPPPPGDFGPGGFFMPPPQQQQPGYGQAYYGGPPAFGGYPDSQGMPGYPGGPYPPVPPPNQQWQGQQAPYWHGQGAPYPPADGNSGYPPPQQQQQGPPSHQSMPLQQGPPPSSAAPQPAPGDVPPPKPQRASNGPPPAQAGQEQSRGSGDARDHAQTNSNLGQSLSSFSSSDVPPGIPLPLDQHDIQPETAEGEKRHQHKRRDDGRGNQKMEFLNVKHNELVHQRFLIVYGQVPGVHTDGEDKIVVHHPYFPPLTFPAVDGYFKVLVELENGDNNLRFDYLQRGEIGNQGTLCIRMTPYMDRPALNLAVIVGRDSQGVFDAPPNARGPGLSDLDAAVRKFRCCAYLWQAYIAEQLYRNGFGRRTFRLDESYEPDTMARDNVQRMTARVHVVRSKRSVAEIQDKERAQQWHPPPGYKRKTDESQFGIANEALDDYGVFKGKHYVVCLSVDSRWDPELGVILGHAALGGGVGDRRLGVFGSHTTHAWPANAEEIAAKFLDTTKTDTRYLANDCNECGEYWRAANIGMGAFLHEAGHLLTLAHTPSGIMSRGFNFYNRTFMARAPDVTGPVRQRDESGSHWHRTDIIRLRHHPCLRLPSDPPLDKRESEEGGFEALPTEDGLLLQSNAGITMVEVWVNGHYRCHREYTAENLERRRNGALPASPDEMASAHPRSILVNLDVWKGWAGGWSDSDKLQLVLTSRSTDTDTLEDIGALMKDKSHRDRDGNLVFQSNQLGKGQMSDSQKFDALFAAKDMRRSSLPKLRSIELRAGQFVDGFILHMDDGSSFPIGKCQGGNRSEVPIAPDDDLDHIVVRSGWWIDGLEFVTRKGHRSGWKGGNGGSEHILKPPQGYAWMGVSGSGAGWLDSISMHYAKLN